MIDAVLRPRDGLAHAPRSQRHEEVLRIQLAAYAEHAAHRHRMHTNRGGIDIHPRGDGRSGVIYELRRSPQIELPAVPSSDETARLEGQPRVPVGCPLSLDHRTREI